MKIMVLGARNYYDGRKWGELHRKSPVERHFNKNNISLSNSFLRVFNTNLTSVDGLGDYVRTSRLSDWQNSKQFVDQSLPIEASSYL